LSSLGSFFDRSEISSAFAGLAAAVSVAVMFKKDIRCRYKSYQNVKTRKLGIVQAGISGREQNRQNVVSCYKRPPSWETSLCRRVDLTPFAQVPTRLVNPVTHFHKARGVPFLLPSLLELAPEDVDMEGRQKKRLQIP